MFFSNKGVFLVILLALLLGIGTACASDLDGVNQTAINSAGDIIDIQQANDDSILTEESGEIIVENWDEIQYYSSLNDRNYVLKLKENTNYYPNDPSDSSNQIIFNNNVTIIGASGAYVGDSSPSPANITYTAMKVPDNNGVGITVKDVLFKWIATSYQPDGVFIQMGGNSTNSFENCYFTDICTNLGHSSILHIKAGDALLSNCTFVNCTTDFGCISVYNPNDGPRGLCLNARMNVSDSYFEGNYARTEPGCINNCGVIVVSNTTFYKNSASRWAGAIHTHGGANTTLYYCDFIANLAGWNGGALYTYSYLQIYGSRFIGNNCTTNNGGGAIGGCKNEHDPYIYVENSYFENNENTCWSLGGLSTDGTGRGGAISIMDSGSLVVCNNTFVKNSASIGTAICAIGGGLSYGDPNIIISGNRFINHTRVGDVLDVRVADEAEALISDNYFLNNSIVFSKLKLTADDPDSSGRVTMHLDAILKNPESYDSDILDKSSYDVFVDGVYKTTVSSRTFTLDLGRGNTGHVYVVPSISNSKSNEVLAGKVKTYVYVAANGNDNSNGLSRGQPVKTLKKAIEIANSSGIEDIVMIRGEFTSDKDLTIDFSLTITAENGAAISGIKANVFEITNGDVKFQNVIFKDCQYGSNANNRIIQQTGTGFLILDGCVFENNRYNCLIESSGSVEAENLVFNGNTACLISSQSIVIRSSNFTANTANTNSRNDALLKYKNSKTLKFEVEDLIFSNNNVLKGCIDLKGPAIISNCNFINNYISATSNQKSSGIYVESGSANVQSCRFINNSDKGDAAVIYCKSEVTVMDSMFINNSYENSNGIVFAKKITADNNWWGSTNINSTRPSAGVSIQSWLVLNAASLSDEIEINNPVPIEFVFTKFDDDGNSTDYDAYNMPGFELQLSAVNGYCHDSRISVKNGRAITYFTLIQESDASLTGTFNGIAATIHFRFAKSIPEISINASNISVGENASVTVNLPADATGEVILTIANITQSQNVSDSKAEFSIPDLAAGNYTIEANYTGNDIFESAIGTANLTVYKHNSTIILSAGDMVLGEDVVFTITLSEHATGTVDIYVNGIKETIAVNQTYTIRSIQRGDYTVRAVYSGDSYYLASEDEYVFSIAKLEPSLTVDVSDISYGEDTIVNVALNDEATGNVSVTIDGKTNVSQLNNGKASVSISGIDAGDNKVVNVDYTGDNKYKNATATKTYNVEKAILNFTLSSSNIKLGQDAVVTVQLPARSGGTLTVTGIKSESKNVPLTGLVTLTYSDLEVGTYDVSVRYDGDNYQTASKSTSFEVLPWDNPQWPNEGYDVKNTEKSPYSSQANGNVKWIMDISGNVIGNIAIDSEGRICIATSNGIYSINPDDGSTNWIFESSGAGSNFSGIAIGRDVILAPKIGDRLYFINQTTGERYQNNFYQASSAFAPIVDGDANVYVSGESYGFDTTKLVVIPYKNWQTSTEPVLVDIGNDEITSSPLMLDENVTFSATSNKLIAVDLPSKSVILTLSIRCDSNPVIGPGNLVYVISNGHILGYNVNGMKMCDVQISGTAGNYISVGENGEIFSINREGKLYEYSVGETLIYDFNESISSRLLVGQDDVLYVGSDSGTFYAIDIYGNLLWKVNLNQSIVGAPAMDENGVIYTISANRLIAIDSAQLKDSKLAADIGNVTYGENVTVNVDADSQATGIVSISINDYHDQSEIANGKVSFTIPNLSAGNYAAEISYGGDMRFDAKKVTAEFAVGKVDPSMDIEFKNINVGETLYVNVTNLPNDASGSVSASVGDKSNSSDISNGNAYLSISGLEKGEYNVKVTYSGDENYNEKTFTKPVSVGYVQVSFNVSSDNVNVGQNVEINISGLPNDANGVLYACHDDVNYTASASNGNAKISIGGLAGGTYSFDVIYTNDTKYSANSQKVHVTVSKVTPTFTVSVNDISVGDDLVVDVSNLPGDATGLAIASIEGLSGNASVVSGKARIIIPQGLDDGTYDVNVSYGGDDKYNEISISKRVTISKVTPEFTVAVNDINVGDDLVVDVFGLPDDASGQIIVEISGMSNKSEVNDGISTVVIHQRLANGTYQVNVAYIGDKKYNSLNEKKSVTISKIDPQVTVAAKSDIDVGEDLIIAISGIPADGKAKYIDIIGDIIGKAAINGSDSQIAISNLTYGKYSYSVYYEGDDRYSSVKIDRSLNVNKVNAIINVSIVDVSYGDNPVVNVSLPGDANGNVIVIVDNKEHSIKASDGKASIILYDLNAGQYNVSVSYADDKYGAISRETSFNVAKINPSIDIGADDISVGDRLNVNVTLPGDATGELTVSVGGKIHIVNIENGISALVVHDLSAGTQSISVQYDGDINYNPITKSKAVSVNKLDVALDVVADDSIEIGDALIITVYLPDAGGNVSVNVDGNVVDAGEVIDGVCKLAIADLKVGNYSYTVNYDGDEKFNPASAVKDVNVNRKEPDMTVSADNVNAGEDLIIEVALPGDATGSVVISVNNKMGFVNLNNGIANYTVSDLAKGSYQLNVTYLGDEKYSHKTYLKSIDVGKQSITFDLSAENADYGQDVIINVTGLPHDASGNVSIAINDMQYALNVNGENTTVNVAGLSAGHYEAIVSYSDDEKYMANQKSVSFEVFKIVPAIIIEAEDIDIGDRLSVNVTLPGDATGELTIAVGDKSYVVNVKQGIISISDLNAGKHTVEVQYGGDSNYAAAANSRDIVVNKINPSLSIQANDIKIGVDSLVKVFLNDDGEGEVVIVFEGKSQSAKLVGGIANVTVSASSEGIKTIDVAYGGDAKYNSINASKSIEASKVTLEVSIEADDIRYGENLTVKVTLPSDATGDVGITAGECYFTSQVSGGTAVFSIPSLNADIDVIIVNYLGDDKYGEILQTKSVFIEKISPTIDVSAGNISVGDSLIVAVDLGSGVTGNVQINVSGISKAADVLDGIAEVEISGLGAGSHMVHVEYAGDRNHYPASAAKQITVSKINTSLIIHAEDIETGKNLQVTVNLNKDATGNVIVDVANISQTADIVDGIAKLNVSGLTSGEYDVIVRYGGDGRYLEAQNSTEIKVLKVEIPVTEDTIPDFDDLTSYSINLPSDASGTLTVCVDGENHTADVVNGKASISIPQLSGGSHNVTVIYSGDGKYAPIYKSRVVNVERIQTSLAVTAEDVEFGEAAVISVEVSSNATGKVILTLDNNDYELDIENGRASLNASGLGIGRYDVVVRYSGDNNYLEAENSTSFNVLKVEIPVTDDTIPDSNDTGNYSINLPSDATGTLTVCVDGENYTADVVNGKASISIPQLSGGNHNVTVAYSGDGKYAPISKSKTVNVDRIPASLIVTANDIRFGDTALINVEVPLKATGKAILTLDNADYELAIDDGRASFNASVLSVGRHDVFVRYSGDINYLEAENSTSFNVLKVDIPVTGDTIPDSGDLTSYSVNLPSDATGTFTVSVDGENYTADVVNGKASISIPKLDGGSHSIVVTYSGDDKYSQITKSKVVNVPIVELTGSDVSMLYTSGKNYKVGLTQDGSPLAGKTVTISIGGKTYKRTTDANGYATLKITLPPKAYSVTASYGDVKATNNVVVKNIINAKNVNAKKSSKSIKIKVSLKKVNNKYLKGKKVTLKFNKKTFKAKTSKKGVAIFTIKNSVYKKLKIGKKYTYKVTYSKNILKKTIKFKK